MLNECSLVTGLLHLSSGQNHRRSTFTCHLLVAEAGSPRCARCICKLSLLWLLLTAEPSALSSSFPVGAVYRCASLSRNGIHMGGGSEQGQRPGKAMHINKESVAP